MFFENCVNLIKVLWDKVCVLFKTFFSAYWAAFAFIVQAQLKLMDSKYFITVLMVLFALCRYVKVDWAYDVYLLFLSDLITVDLFLIFVGITGIGRTFLEWVAPNYQLNMFNSARRTASVLLTLAGMKTFDRVIDVELDIYEKYRKDSVFGKDTNSGGSNLGNSTSSNTPQNKN